METEEIRINDKFVSIVRVDNLAEKPDIPVSTIKSQSTNIFLKKVNQKYTITQIGMSPRNCRYLEKIDQSRIIVIIEEPPSFRTLFYAQHLISSHLEALEKEKIIEYKINPNDYKGEICKFSLALPYIQFIMMFNSSRLEAIYATVRPKPIISLSDNLFIPPFPNINDACNVCLGDAISGSSNLVLAVDQALKRFWSSHFNADYLTNFTKYQSVPIIGNLFDWQYMSEKDPMFIYKADWLPTDHTCQSFITLIKSSYKTANFKPLTYPELYNIFNMKQNYATTKKRSRRTVTVYEDVASGVNLLKTKDEPTMTLYIGDSITVKGKTLFTESFLSSDTLGIVEYIRFIRDDGKYIIYKLTKKTRSFLARTRKKMLFEDKAVLENGLEVKAGDILILDGRANKKLFKKILYIRKTVEGRIELRAADRYFTTDNIPSNVSKFDISNIILDGVKLNEGEEYIISTRVAASNPALQSLSRGKFVEMVVTNTLAAKFKPAIGFGAADILIPADEVGVIMKELDFEKLPPIFCMGRSIVETLSEAYRKDNVLYFLNGIQMIMDGATNFNRTCIETLQEGSFVIKSNCLDFIFEVGDEVVVSNWSSPIEMLKIKKIIGIGRNNEKRQIEFYLEDKDGNKTSFPYVEKNCVHIGSVRRIIREYNGLERGSKIVSKTTDAKGFPKDSVNIIIGFINDTGTSEPLVFCSNGLTLWFSDIQEKFDVVERSSKVWNSLNHVPIELSKIEYQPGDLVECSSNYRALGGFMTYRNNESDPHLLAFITRSILNFPDYYNLDKIFLSEMKLNGILNPREPFGIGEKCLPNFHGGYYRTPFINHPTSYNSYFQPGKGRLYNVSNSN